MTNIDRIEKLLYGWNYQVSLHLYGPIKSEIALIDGLKSNVSFECEIYGINSVSRYFVIDKIMNCILYEGDSGSGPIDLDSKRTELVELTTGIIRHIGIDQADFISEFIFKSGHPAYPVFWDFAFDIHGQDTRWVFVGSSSD